MTSGYSVNLGPELLKNLLSCVAADGGTEIAESIGGGMRRPEIAENAWDVLRPIQTVSCARSSR
jgi:hypothetical protein